MKMLTDFRRCAALLVVAFGCVAGFSQLAEAQLTPQLLLGESVTDIPQTVGTEIQQAITLFGNKRFDDARERLKASRKRFPQLPPAGVLMAQMFMIAKDAQNARRELEMSVVMEEGDPEPYLVFGGDALRQGQITHSDLCFEKAMELNKAYKSNQKRQRLMDARIYAGKAAVASAREQYAAAERYIEEWIKIDPDSTTAYSRLGEMQFRQGADRYSDALKTFDKLYSQIDKATDPRNKVARPEVNMAVLLTRAKDLKQARAAMIQASKRAAPDDLQTHVAIAKWGIEYRDLDLAAASAKKAALIDPKNAEAKVLVGLVARFQKDWDAAESAFRSVLATSPSNFAGLNHLALVLIESTEDKERRLAVEYAQLNSRANPDPKTANGREAAATLAYIFHRLGRDPEAEQLITQVMNAGNVSNEAAYYAATILNTRGKKDAAKKILEATLQRNGNFPLRGDAETLLAQLNSGSTGSLLP